LFCTAFVAGAIGNPQPAVFPELVLGLETAGFFNDGAKHMPRDRTYSRDVLKLTHFPKLFSHSLHFLERILPLLHRVIVLRVQAQNHPPFFFSGQLWEILLAPPLGKNF